jgi:hypothetical protein
VKKIFDLQKNNRFQVVAVALVFGAIGTYLLVGSRAAAACDLNATTSTFNTQVAAAQPGQTVCLSSGDYGEFTGVNKAVPGITIAAASGANITMSYDFRAPSGSTVSGITFDGINDIVDGVIAGNVKNITFKNSTFTGGNYIFQASGVQNNACSSCSAITNANIVYDHDTFNLSNTPAGTGFYEGRVSFLGPTSQPAGITIKNSVFENNCADGIQFGDGGNGVTIGPGNEFRNLRQTMQAPSANPGTDCGPHVDAIQFVGSSNPGPTITGNYFHDDSTAIANYDGGTFNVNINNNVLVQTDDLAGNPNFFLMAGDTGSTLTHNTVIGNDLFLGYSHDNTPATGQTVKDNVFTGGGVTVQAGTNSPAIVDYNLCATTATCAGAHSIKGTPTFVGGASPTTYSGFALASTSTGVGKASDSTDLGIAATTTPSPDTTPPTVSVTTPTTGSTVSGTVSLTATAADDTGVAGVQFKVDGTNVGSEDTASPYSASWNTTGVANGSHTITAIARDASGNTQTSSSVTVTVSNTVPDTTAPTVTVTAPSAGATVSGPVSLTATASDNSGTVSGVQFKVDGTSVGAEDTTSPYGVTWDSTQTSNGTHTITAVARDPSGNTKTSTSVSVTVSNPVPDTTAPTVSVTAPTGGSTISGTINLTASASDNVGVAGVQFKVDGTNVGSEDTASPYTASWNTTTATNGTHTIAATARDAAGNTTTSTSVSITVNNIPADTTAPTTAITAPVSGGTVNGTTTVTANASDNVSVTKVDFYLDGNLISSDATSPYSFGWTTTSVTNGSHSLLTKAYDAAGNIGTSSTVTVTVNNPDTTAPSVPTNLKATATSPTSVSLTWNASTDNVGVASYLVQRDGVVIATVTAPTTNYTDTTVAGSTTYSYQVLARDAATNTSSGSTAATVTTPTPPDTTPPSAPTNLIANASSTTQVNLSWDAANDNASGIARYDVYRNGSLLTSSATTSLADATVLPSTSYSYYVKAVDGAGNASTASVTVSVTTPTPPPPAQKLTSTPSADTYVMSNKGGTNFGNQSVVRGDSNPGMLGLYKFSINGIGTKHVNSAKLRVYVSDGSDQGGQLYKLLANNWSEYTVTYNTRPSADTSLALSNYGQVNARTWVEADLTSLITGDGTYGVMLRTNSNNTVGFSSKETSYKPQLILEVQ